MVKKDVARLVLCDRPTGLPVGTSTGSITFTSNAVNGTVTVPVDLQIVPKGPPLIFFRGWSTTPRSFPANCRPGRYHGRQGRAAFVQPVHSRPGAAAADESRRDVGARERDGRSLFYTSYGQIAFQMPVDTPPGPRSYRCSATTGRSAIRHRSRWPRERRGCSSTVNQDGSINAAASSRARRRRADHLRDRSGRHQPGRRDGAPAPSAEPLARVTPTPVVCLRRRRWEDSDDASVRRPDSRVCRALPGERERSRGISQGRGRPRESLSATSPSNSITLYVQ